MRRESAEFIVNKFLVGCLPPHLILGQEDCSRPESSQTKEVLLSRNHEAFFKDLPRTFFWEHHPSLWEDFKPNAFLLIDDTAKKGALGDNGIVLVLPSCCGFLNQ
jgi:hypothetical protein